MSANTLLVITGLGLPAWSARGLTQTLDPIEQSVNIRYTLNGAPVNVAPAQFKQYRSVITCTDMRLPAIDGVFPGALVTVDCIEPLPYVTAGGSPARTVVPGTTPKVEGAYTFYRPRLSMMVVNFSTTRDEFRRAVGWTLELIERPA